jgi:hypothetical protein
MRLRRYIRPLARLTAFVVVCAALLGYVDYRVARASVMERLLAIGQRMAPYLDDARGTEAPRELRVNGVRLLVAAGHSEHPPSLVRKWYSDRYAAKGDGLGKLGDELRAKGALPPGAPALNQLAFGDDRRGGVAALDLGEALDLPSLRTRIKRFLKSGDLGDVGRLRYVYCEADGEGGTRFLTVWTDEHFDLARLLPKPSEQRDAEGSDLDGVPRYPGTLRVLSADERGMPERVVVYEGPGSPEIAELFYRSRMAAAGWQLDERFADLARKQGHTSLRCESRDGHEVVIDLSSTERGQGVTVCIVQTR